MRDKRRKAGWQRLGDRNRYAARERFLAKTADKYGDTDSHCFLLQVTVVDSPAPLFGDTRIV
jgi:hypothetical protein